jgi:hypothetical protein
MFGFFKAPFRWECMIKESADGRLRKLSTSEQEEVFRVVGQSPTFFYKMQQKKDKCVHFIDCSCSWSDIVSVASKIFRVDDPTMDHQLLFDLPNKVARYRAMTSNLS